MADGARRAVAHLADPERIVKHAWKVVVPFAVADRYAQARAAGNKAATRIEALTRESAQRGCDAR